MKVEIERKFLLASEGWRREVHRSDYIRDGLVASSDERKARVRIIGERATLTVKSQRVAGSRYEFEYDIQLEDAELILSSCGNNATAKRRHYVLHGGLTWEIDEYDGILKGIVMAEVELDAIDQLIDMPGWIGPEVTAQAPYRKINMLQARQRDLTNPPSET